MVDVPRLGPRRLCGSHARFARTYARLPGPRVPSAPRPLPSPPPAPRGRETRWTTEEDAVLCARIDEPAGVTASLLGRSTDAVHHRRAWLRRAGGWVGRYHQPWSPGEDRFLVEHPDLPAREVAAELGRTTASVRGRRATLKRQGRG